MQCDQVREALSARLDGEADPVGSGPIDDHLAGCPACTAWAEEVATLHRMVRVREAEPVPDLSAAILAGTGPTSARRPSRLAATWAEPISPVRWVLFVVGLTQLVLAAPDLLGQGGDLAAHASRELGAFDVALGVGFLVAAWQPARAWGLLPVATALALVMAGTAVLDVAGGSATAAGELHHLLDVAGVAALWSVARDAGQPVRRPLTQPAT